jgi:RNA-splicing ligase RtcB
MMDFVFPTKYAEFKIYSPDNRIDQKVFNQVNDLANLEIYKDSKIRLMPDFHAGYNSIVGLTMTINNAITPNIIGLDLGCGIMLRKLHITKEIDYARVDKTIRMSIPSGYHHHDFDYDHPKYSDLLHQVTTLFSTLHAFTNYSNQTITNQVGTLGGGNHFIEMDRDDDNNFYLMVHSGSRNIGKTIASHYQTIAKTLQENRQDKPLVSKKYIGIPHEELAYISKDLRPKLFQYYIEDMLICQQFAKLNRQWILDSICTNMDFEYDIQEDMDTIHNYIDLEHMIVRKGAVSAQEGEKVVIPLNMKDGAIIGVGKGNEDWNYSAPHGAGRKLSRSQAFNTLKLKDFQKLMEGVYSTCINTETIDECPSAYKDVDQIVWSIRPTLDVIQHLTPVFNFKAG